MGIKTFLSLPFARFVVFKNNAWKNNAVKVQEKLMLELVRQAENTVFGKDHDFEEIKSYSDFKNKFLLRIMKALKLIFSK